MILLLIIADDFTGALDTGVQFAAHGIRTQVVVDPQVDFSDHDAKVLVVDTETRHLPPKEAYDVVSRLSRRAKEAGVSYIYKKTDSALRGNIGAELSAVLEAGGDRQMPFFPAFPQIGRITREGVHYVDGVPVTDSPFGRDPFEPVKHAVVTELIAEQSALPSESFPPLQAEDPVPEMDGILVFDAGSLDDLSATGQRLMEEGRLSVMAGCAGFGAVLPELLGLTSGQKQPVPKLDPRLLVVCGSVNPITLAQLDAAEGADFQGCGLPCVRSWNPVTGKVRRERKISYISKRCLPPILTASLRATTWEATSPPPITRKSWGLIWKPCGYAFPEVWDIWWDQFSPVLRWEHCFSPAAIRCCNV